ncbi:PREDICTED: zona pellucida sperm-binding protein 3-like, partial [Calidris pugnax]|uniref:zona pellucida sperm-binding protein 3-like n=1 Tax=Calidris pugnax TaxID=198806 RepID=UPI00071DB2B4
MGSGGSLGLFVLCWVLAEAVSSSPWRVPPRGSRVLEVRGDSSWSHPRVPSFSQPSPWAWVDVSQLQAAAPLHPVSVECQEAQVVVRVHRDLFGTGHLVKAGDLRLGSAGCLPVGQGAAESRVTFVAGLHECGSSLQLTPDSLIYKTSLSYKPTPSGNLGIVRTNPAVVPIECHYPRKGNVSSHGVRPTWAPFRSTLLAEERLTFSLRLLTDDWSSERVSNGFQLGERLHLEAAVASGGHVPLRLFVDECVATLSPDRTSSPRYALIELGGCLVDGRSEDSSSTFISPRLRQDTLRFTVDAFKFAGDERNLIYLTCQLKVSPEDQAPSPWNKACSFNKASSLWAPVEGTGDICSCCETGNCPSHGGYSQRIHPPARWSGRRLKRDIPSKQGGSSMVAEAEVSLGPLVILDPAQELWTSSGGPAPAGKTPPGGSSVVAEAEVSLGPLVILDPAQELWTSSGGPAPAGKTPP